MREMLLQQQPVADTSTLSRSDVVYTPRFDIYEAADAFVLSGDLPGVSAEAVEIRFENKVLTICGRVPARNAGGKFWASEYGVGDYYRSFILGDEVDASAIEADLKDGVLTLRLPKRTDAQPKRITVRAR